MYQNYLRISSKVGKFSFCKKEKHYIQFLKDIMFKLDIKKLNSIDNIISIGKDLKFYLNQMKIFF